MANAISLSSASMTGAIAATAEPPQIPVPEAVRHTVDLIFQLLPDEKAFFYV